MNMNLKDNRLADADDPVVAQALRDFKSSVDAWSDAALSSPRSAATAARYGWRLTAGWALGCLLAAGGVTASLYQHQHRQELARMASDQAMQKAQQALAAQQQPIGAQMENDDLLATVDSDISRQVPAALEPLAQMMDDGGTE